jgi:hypothetical protein
VRTLTLLVEHTGKFNRTQFTKAPLMIEPASVELTSKEMPCVFVSALLVLSGFVVDPYLEYKPLLPTILTSLKSGSDMTLRKELVMLSAVCCLLSAVCCLLSAVCCLLSAVCCLLCAVC